MKLLLFKIIEKLKKNMFKGRLFSLNCSKHCTIQLNCSYLKNGNIHTNITKNTCKPVTSYFYYVFRPIALLL